MNRHFIAILIIAAAVVGGGVWYVSQQPDAPTVAKDEHGGERGGEHKEEQSAEKEKPHVALTPDQIAKAGIKVETVGAATIRETLPLYGVIAPNAERVREVSARFAGTIRSIAKKVGDPVRQGETLATVESNESLQTYSLPAPLAGVVIARNANPGEQTGEKVLFTVGDLSTVWVEMSLFPRDVAKVRIGQRVRVSSADSEPSAEGEVIYISPVSNSANQTRTARVLLDNAEKLWAPGSYVTAEIVIAESSVPMAVQSVAVQTLEGETVVFVKGAEGFESRALKLGRTDGQNTEVLDGLKPGETYVGKNSFILKAELGKGEAEHGH